MENTTFLRSIAKRRTGGCHQGVVILGSIVIGGATTTVCQLILFVAPTCHAALGLSIGQAIQFYRMAVKFDGETPKQSCAAVARGGESK